MSPLAWSSNALAKIWKIAKRYLDYLLSCYNSPSPRLCNASGWIWNLALFENLGKIFHLSKLHFFTCHISGLKRNNVHKVSGTEFGTLKTLQLDILHVKNQKTRCKGGAQGHSQLRPESYKIKMPALHTQEIEVSLPTDQPQRLFNAFTLQVCKPSSEGYIVKKTEDPWFLGFSPYWGSETLNRKVSKCVWAGVC